jgi:hypothetical protein
MSAEDAKITQVLTETRTIALVGASPKPDRDSHRVMAYLQAHGYRVIRVNPALSGERILGEMVYPNLGAIPGPVDLADIFRKSDAAGQIVDEAIACGAKAVWLQLGVIDAAAARRAEAAGLAAIMDRCPKIEIRRLGIKPVR